MADIVGLVLPFFGMILLGAIAARITRQPLEALGWMNTFIVYIALPALFFQLIARTPIEQLTEWRYIFGVVLSTYLIFSLMFVGSVIVSRGDIAESTIKGLAAAYGNIGYMGPGLALLALGPEAAVPVALIFCFDNILHFVMAPLMMAVGGDRSRPTSVVAREVLVKIFTHPFILATIVGVAAAIVQFRPPEPIERLLELLANAAAPCALFAMGVTLALRPLKRVPMELSTIVPMKLLVQPVVAWLLLGVFGDFDPIWVQTAILLACLPTATNVFVMAQQYGVWVERASATVLVTTVLSVGTVTLLVFLLSSGLVPTDPFPQ